MPLQRRSPRPRPKRVHVGGSVDLEVVQTLDMLGFNVPKLIEELLGNVAGLKKCPLCGRQLKPLITGRKVQP